MDRLYSRNAAYLQSTRDIKPLNQAITIASRTIVF